MYGSQPGAKELLLELMLLDAGVTLPRDTYALRASYGGPMVGGCACYCPECSKHNGH